MLGAFMFRMVPCMVNVQDYVNACIYAVFLHF